MKGGVHSWLIRDYWRVPDETPYVFLLPQHSSELVFILFVTLSLTVYGQATSKILAAPFANLLINNFGPFILFILFHSSFKDCSFQELDM